MKIWVTRHGQTCLNRQKLMQGQLDIPLNDTGKLQASRTGELVRDVHFDAVISSPLTRAVQTAALIAGIPEDDVQKDDRIIEVSFGRYEKRSYFRLGFAMTLYWLLPEVFHAPETVEPTSSMIARSRDFLRELETKDYENVLVVCHGGIIRTICGYLEDRKNGLKWRPKPNNCEIRVYESENGKHRFLRSVRLPKQSRPKG